MSTKLKTIPLPAGLAPLPKGSVYLGEEIPQQKATFKGWTLGRASNKWTASDDLLGGFAGHYAAPRDSAIAREILGVKPQKKAAKPVSKRKLPPPPEGFEAYGKGPLKEPGRTLKDVVAIDPAWPGDSWSCGFRGDEGSLVYALRIGSLVHRNNQPFPAMKKTAKKATMSRKPAALRRLPKNVKPGTKVVCVVSSGAAIKDGMYTIAYVDDDDRTFLMEDDKHTDWHRSRDFRLAPAKKRVQRTKKIGVMPAPTPHQDESRLVRDEKAEKEPEAGVAPEPKPQVYPRRWARLVVQVADSPENMKTLELLEEIASRMAKSPFAIVKRETVEIESCKTGKPSQPNP